MDEGVRKTFPESVMVEDLTETWARFRLPCLCHSSDHDIYIDMEYDSKIQMMSLRFYFKVCTRLYTSWWKELLHRWKLTWRLWSRGHIETDGEYLFRGDGAILEFATTIFQGYHHLQEKRVEKEQTRIQHEVAYYEDINVSD